MARRTVDSLVRWFTGRPFPLRLALLAILLSLPALWVGLQLDDFPQRLVMLGAGPLEVRPLEVFRLVDGDREMRRRMVEHGFLPWWTSERARFVFFRPAAALSMLFDYRLWPGSPVLMHVHSLAWLGLMVAAAALAYRRILGVGWAAGLAALLYAVDDAHALPASWLANRNALMATAFGLAALAVHDRWRRSAAVSGWRRLAGAPLSCLLLALALLSGEIGLGALGYFLAYACFLEPVRGARRWLSLVPAGLVAGGWAVLYKLGGYGVVGSGIYVDPLREPLGFAVAVLRRAPLLLLGQWSPVPADAASVVPVEQARVLFAGALVLIALLAALFLPLLRGAATARFFATGMLLALLPVCATFASNRLLSFVGFGGAGLLALFLGAVASASGVSRAARWAAVALAVVHLPLSALASPFFAYSTRTYGQAPNLALATLPGDAGRDVIVVNAPDYLTYVSNARPVRHALGLPLARRVLALASGPVPVSVTRLDGERLRVTLPDGFFNGQLAWLFHSPDDRLEVGRVIGLETFTAEIAAVRPDGQPSEVVFTFPQGLDSPSLAFVRFDSDAYLPFVLPAVGTTATLEAAIGPFERLGRPGGD